MFGFLNFCALLALASAISLPILPEDFNGLSDEVLSGLADDVANKFVEEYFKYRKTGVETPELRQISSQLAKMHTRRAIFAEEPSELVAADAFFLCTTCRATAKVAVDMVRDKDGELNGEFADENAKLLTLDFCRRFNFHTDEVCLGAYESNWPVIQYIAKESNMDSRTFCSLFLGLNFCKTSKNPEYDFTISVDHTHLPPTGPKSNAPQIEADSITVLHISDIHHDPLYEPGSLAGCDEPLCCQRHKAVALASNREAGYWGDYRDCDSPWHTVENAFEHMKKTHPRIDFIYQTGDVVDHYVWATTKERNIEIITKVDNKLAEIFPGIPVYPCIGNHEPHPLNAFSPDDVPQEVSTTWLYESLYKSWSKWLPASTKETILKGGYYTVSPKKGFRIITLNNNDCYNSNWWLFYNGTNKIPQLQWFHDTLRAAEKSKEYVHVLLHLPTGGETCWAVWSREFDRIVARFSDTISGLFNGHSHKDEMALHYSAAGHAVGVVWNGGSITPASNKNPNYRFYHLERANMEVAESETWIFNLTLANLRGAAQSPEWYKMYDFRTEFTTDLSPHGIDKLFDEFAENPNMLRRYWAYLSTMADPRLERGCDRNCLMNAICRASTTVSDQRRRCHELQEKLSKSLDAEESATPTPNPLDGGAASMATMSLSIIMSSYLAIKCIF